MASVGTNNIKWWDYGFGYEIYPRTFNDSNDDGIGDLVGIIEKIPYLANLGVDAIWICPIYLSPGIDCGYDVADYYTIDPMFGTNEDFQKLLDTAHEHNIKVLIDIVPNHTSDQHELFQKALTSKDAPERDYFIFRDPKPDGSEPNNWLSVFGGSAWKYHEATGQYYLHLFYPEQPDLNWRNPKVHELFENILRNWFSKGVDGFRIDVSQGLYKHEDLPDALIIDPMLPNSAAVEDKFKNVDDTLYYCLPETPLVFENWVKIAAEYGAVMVGEMPTTTPERLSGYFREGGLNTVTYLASCWAAWEPEEIIRFFKEGEDVYNNKITWMMSNHDNKRAVTRYGGGDIGLKRSLAMTSFTSLISGFPFLYQGEELGLEDVKVDYKYLRDPMGIDFPENPDNGRDPCRTNMPWDSKSKWQGFTNAETPWLNSNDRKLQDCVDIQLGDLNSPFYHFKNALNLRKDIYKDILDNNYEFNYFASKTHFGYQAGPYLVALNTDSNDVLHDIEGEWTRCYCSDPQDSDAPTYSGSVVFKAETTIVYKKK